MKSPFPNTFMLPNLKGDALAWAEVAGETLLWKLPWKTNTNRCTVGHRTVCSLQQWKPSPTWSLTETVHIFKQETMNLFRKSCKLLKPYCIWVNEVTFCLISNFSPLPLWAWALHVHMQSVNQQANFLKIAYRSFLGLPKQTTTNGWLDTGGIYSFTVPEATSPKSRYWQGWFLLWAREESVPGLSLSFCVRQSLCVLLSW